MLWVVLKSIKEANNFWPYHLCVLYLCLYSLSALPYKALWVVMYSVQCITGGSSP